MFKFNEVGVHLMHLLTLPITQNRLRSNCSDFIKRDEWLSTSLKPSSLDCHVWGNAGSLPCLQPKPKTILKLKDALQQILTALPHKCNC